MELVTKKKLHIVSGRANLPLAVEIADCLGVELGEPNCSEFANGEIAPLVEPRLEHDGRPAADRKQEVEPDPEEREEPIRELHSAPDARRGVR